MLIHERSTHWLTPQWNVPASVHGVVSTTAGHLSRGAYRGFNTADHVGADPHEVKLCRQFFQQKFATRNNPQWLDQVHGTAVVTADGKGKLLTGDACYTDQSDLVCTLHTADCLPVFFSDRAGAEVALAHAGWRGLAAGVLENCLARFHAQNKDVICWLGPAISQRYFEIGEEVKAIFEDAQAIPKNAFIPSGRVSELGCHYLCDLYALARERLQGVGVHDISGGDLCTYADSRFFSYRRTKTTGRILSAIWIAPAV